MIVVARPAWHRRAACHGLDPDLFFPAVGGAEVESIKAVCATCPVAAECIDAGIDNAASTPDGHANGWWGGLGPDALNRERARRNRLAVAS